MASAIVLFWKSFQARFRPRLARKWIDWWQRRSRTPAWALRYGGNFQKSTSC